MVNDAAMKTTNATNPHNRSARTENAAAIFFPGHSRMAYIVRTASPPAAAGEPKRIKQTHRREGHGIAPAQFKTKGPHNHPPTRGATQFARSSRQSRCTQPSKIRYSKRSRGIFPQGPVTKNPRQNHYGYRRLKNRKDVFFMRGEAGFLSRATPAGL
jgi:hypothetical protein